MAMAQTETGPDDRPRENLRIITAHVVKYENQDELL